MNTDILGWAVTGLLTSVLAPALVLGTRLRIACDHIALPAALALPGFITVHGLITLELAQHPAPPLWLGLHLPLLAGALIFWLPIFGHRTRLADPLRALYLLLSVPTLDFAGVLVIILGDPAGGVAMIVGMLPVGIIAIAVTWQWIYREEQAAPTITFAHLPSTPEPDPDTSSHRPDGGG